MRRSRRLIFLTVFLTGIAVLVAMNFMTNEKKIDTEIAHLYSAHDPQFLRTMGVLLGPAIVGGNAFAVLRNGDEIFPPMLAAIRGAQKSISFETYIYWSGAIGREFADALTERARAGVKVHVLLDWVGSVKMENAYLDQMKRAGIEVEKFHQPRWYNLGRLNNRTHRKLLVVDGRVGFTGGVGIADQWAGAAQDPDHWRDTHFRAEGPVAAQMQAVFIDNWTKTTGKVLDGDDYFPALPAEGGGFAQMFSSSPSSGSESMHLMYLLALAAAEHTIELSSSYFVPDDLVIQAIVHAVERGVKVRIITPGKHIDTETVRGASHARWGDLLKAGVEVYEYQPTMFHVKVLIVDDFLVSVGSTNFDNRSFRLNDEANLNIYNTKFAREQVEVFNDDLRRARRMTWDEWSHRPWSEKLWEHAASLLGPQL